MGNTCKSTDQDGCKLSNQQKYSTLFEEYQEWQLSDSILRSNIPLHSLETGRDIKRKQRNNNSNNISGDRKKARIYMAFNKFNKANIEQQINTYFFRSSQNPTNFPLVQVLGIELRQTTGNQKEPNSAGQRSESPQQNQSFQQKYATNDIFQTKSWFNVIVEKVINFADDQNIPQLSYEQCIYVLFQALSGYYYLYKKHGRFTISEKMLGFNLEGKLKVWLSENYAQNHPKDAQPTLYTTKVLNQREQLKREWEMIDQIFEIIEKKYEKPAEMMAPSENRQKTTFRQRFMSEVQQVLRQNIESTKHSQVGFQALLQLLSDFEQYTQRRYNGPLIYFIPNNVARAIPYSAIHSHLNSDRFVQFQQFTARISRMRAQVKQKHIRQYRSRSYQTGEKGRSLSQVSKNKEELYKSLFSLPNKMSTSNSRLKSQMSLQRMERSNYRSLRQNVKSGAKATEPSTINKNNKPLLNLQRYIRPLNSSQHRENNNETLLQQSYHQQNVNARVKKSSSQVSSSSNEFMKSKLRIGKGEQQNHRYPNKYCFNQQEDHKTSINNLTATTPKNTQQYQTYTQGQHLQQHEKQQHSGKSFRLAANIERCESSDQLIRTNGESSGNSIVRDQQQKKLREASDSQEKKYKSYLQNVVVPRVEQKTKQTLQSQKPSMRSPSSSSHNHHLDPPMNSPSNINLNSSSGNAYQYSHTYNNHPTNINQSSMTKIINSQNRPMTLTVNTSQNKFNSTAYHSAVPTPPNNQHSNISTPRNRQYEYTYNSNSNNSGNYQKNRINKIQSYYTLANVNQNQHQRREQMMKGNTEKKDREVLQVENNNNPFLKSYTSTQPWNEASKYKYNSNNNNNSQTMSSGSGSWYHNFSSHSKRDSQRRQSRSYHLDGDHDSVTNSSAYGLNPLVKRLDYTSSDKQGLQMIEKIEESAVQNEDNTPSPSILYTWKDSQKELESGESQQSHKYREEGSTTVNPFGIHMNQEQESISKKHRDK